MATVEHMLVINMTKEGTEDRIEWEKEKTKRNNWRTVTPHDHSNPKIHTWQTRPSTQDTSAAPHATIFQEQHEMKTPEEIAFLSLNPAIIKPRSQQILMGRSEGVAEGEDLTVGGSV